MLIAVDIGNTNIKLGFFEEDELKQTMTFSTDLNKTADEYAVELFSLLRLHSISRSAIDGCIISSVVPSVTSKMKIAVERVAKVAPLIVGPGVKTGLDIKIEDPSTLGADLVVASAAAKKLYPSPSVVISMGTATVMCVIDRSGSMIGGPIAPGVGISLNALTESAALLYSVSLDAPKSVIGKNTDKSIRAGVVWGAVCMIDGMIDMIEEELGEKVTVVACGGLARFIIPHCRHTVDIHDDLMLLGLKMIYDKNR